MDDAGLMVVVVEDEDRTDGLELVEDDEDRKLKDERSTASTTSATIAAVTRA